MVMEGVPPRTSEDEAVSINRILLLVAAVATAFIIAIYSVLIRKWTGLNVACLLAFGAIFLTYVFLLIRGGEMDLLA